MNTNKTSARFTIDFINHKIVGTKASFDKAGKGEGAIYEELASKIAKHPDFTLKVKEQKKHSTTAKRTYNGMNFSFMEAYIETRLKAEQIKKEYEAVKKMAEDSKISVYPFTKKWFLGEFDPDNQGFDMDKAKKEIAEYRMAKAVLTTTTATDKNARNDLAQAS